MKHDPHAHADGSRECRPAHDMGPAPGGWPDWPTVAKAVLPLVNADGPSPDYWSAPDMFVLTGTIPFMRHYAETVPYVAPVDPIVEAAREIVERLGGAWDHVGPIVRAAAQDCLRAGVEIGKAQQPVRDLPNLEAVANAWYGHGYWKGDIVSLERADRVLALIANPEAQRS